MHGQSTYQRLVNKESCQLQDRFNLEAIWCKLVFERDFLSMVLFKSHSFLKICLLYFSSLSSGDSGQLSEEGGEKRDRARKHEDSRKSSDSGHSSEVGFTVSGNSSEVRYS
jgi:hypothetical protein